MRKIIDEVDVICSHNADGTIVPLRLRFMNEDGEYETYTIKGCREAEKKGTHTTEDGIYVSVPPSYLNVLLYLSEQKESCGHIMTRE